MDEKERHERGMAQRRKVLGNEWVDRANAQEDRLQRGIPGFHHPRRLGRDLDAAALRRAHPPHPGDRHHDRARPMGRIPPARARGARRRRLVRDDIKEIILQQAIYCGVPAANHAFKEAAEVMASWRRPNSAGQRAIADGNRVRTRSRATKYQRKGVYQVASRGVPPARPHGGFRISPSRHSCARPCRARRRSAANRSCTVCFAHQVGAVRPDRRADGRDADQHDQDQAALPESRNPLCRRAGRESGRGCGRRRCRRPRA